MNSRRIKIKQIYIQFVFVYIFDSNEITQIDNYSTTSDIRIKIPANSNINIKIGLIQVIWQTSVFLGCESIHRSSGPVRGQGERRSVNRQIHELLNRKEVPLSF